MCCTIVAAEDELQADLRPIPYRAARRFRPIVQAGSEPALADGFSDSSELWSTHTLRAIDGMTIEVRRAMLAPADVTRVLRGGVRRSQRGPSGRVARRLL